MNGEVMSVAHVAVVMPHLALLLRLEQHHLRNELLLGDGESGHQVVIGGLGFIHIEFQNFLVDLGADRAGRIVQLGFVPDGLRRPDTLPPVLEFDGLIGLAAFDRIIGRLDQRQNVVGVIANRLGVDLGKQVSGLQHGTGLEDGLEKQSAPRVGSHHDWRIDGRVLPGAGRTGNAQNRGGRASGHFDRANARRRLSRGLRPRPVEKERASGERQNREHD